MKFKSSSRDEISNKVTAARHYSEQARIPGISPAIQFTLAYDAARMWCEVVVRAEGLRISRQGYHEKTIKTVAEYLGEEIVPIVNHLDRVRKARNKIQYDGLLDQVSSTDVEELLESLDDLSEKVTAWLKQKHPDLLPLL